MIIKSPKGYPHVVQVLIIAVAPGVILVTFMCDHEEASRRHRGALTPTGAERMVRQMHTFWPGER